MNRERIDQGCENGILGLVLAILIYGPLATGAVRAREFFIIEGLSIGVLFLWLIRLWFGKAPRLLWPPVCWGVLGFMVYAGIRYYYADIEYLARAEVIHILVYGIIFMAIVSQLHRQESGQFMVLVLIFVGMAISLYAAYQFFTKSPYVWNYLKPAQYGNRGTGTYICPNHLAGFLEMLIPVGFCCIFMGRFQHVTKVLIGYASLVMLAGLTVTISRGGWAASAISLGILFFVLLRKPRYRLPALVFLVALLTAAYYFFEYSPQGQKRFEELVATGKVENIRFKLWWPAIQVWQDNYWFGAGPGHFDYAFGKYRPEDCQLRPERVHNDYLNALADWGLVGALLIAATWGTLFYGAIRIWKYVQRSSHDFSAKKSTKGALVLGCSVGLIALLLHAIVDFNFYVPANAITAVTLMAILTSHWRFATDNYWIPRRWWTAGLTTLFCLLGMGLLGYHLVRAYKEHVWLLQVERYPNSPDAMHWLEKAYAAEPKNFYTTYRIAESWRVYSWRGEDDYREAGERAILWFNRAIAANPLDAKALSRCGMALDWLRRNAEAGPYYLKASMLEPNNYYVVALMGWHRVQIATLEAYRENWSAARRHYEISLALFERSYWLQANDVAYPYRYIVRRKLAELPKDKE